MMLILTYQLQAVLHYSPLRTGLTLIPFALAAACGSVLIARRLMRSVAPRWLISAGVVLSAAGLLPLLGLTPSGHCLALIVLAEVIEGIGHLLIDRSCRAGVPPQVAAAASQVDPVGAVPTAQRTQADQHPPVESARGRCSGL
jgi:hypothetical protein